MHGIIFSELRKYVDTKLGSEGWNQLLADSQLGRRMYLPIQDYPDEEMGALVATAARTLNVPAAAILEDFGTFIAPSLVGLYRTLVKPEWKTLDLLENTEQTIHTVVRARNPGARPAQLHAIRTAPDVVDLTYHSERRLCAVAKGIVKGIALHYGESISITESMCMHDGGAACRMEVRVVAASVVADPATAKGRPAAQLRKTPVKESAKKTPKVAAKAPVEKVATPPTKKTVAAAKGESTGKVVGAKPAQRMTEAAAKKVGKAQVKAAKAPGKRVTRTAV
jgi:hypothetical protein